MMANVTKNEKAEFFDRVSQQFGPTNTSSTTTSRPSVPTTFTFTEDLKLALSLAENDHEVDLVVKMARNYNSQKLGHSHSHLSYIFGPLVMRLLHLFNKPTIAYQLFTDPDFQQTGFFSQVSSRTILLDLLLENQLHQQLFHIFNMQPITTSPPPSSSSLLSFSSSSSSSLPSSSSLHQTFTSFDSQKSSTTTPLPSSQTTQSSPLQTTPPSPSPQTTPSLQQPSLEPPSPQHRIPADHLTILAASCFRQNNSECLEVIKKLILNNNNNNIEISPRTYVYASMLAYNQGQGQAEVGLEILRRIPKDSKSTNTPAYLNAMVLLLGMVGEVGKAVLLLEAMVTKLDVFQEVLTSTQQKCNGNDLLSQRLSTITDNLRNSGMLLPISFQHYLNSTIRTPKTLQNSSKKARIGRAGVDRSNGYFPIPKARPGLK